MEFREMTLVTPALIGSTSVAVFNTDHWIFIIPICPRAHVYNAMKWDQARAMTVITPFAMSPADIFPFAVGTRQSTVRV